MKPSSKVLAALTLSAGLLLAACGSLTIEVQMPGGAPQPTSFPTPAILSPTATRQSPTASPTPTIISTSQSDVRLGPGTPVTVTAIHMLDQEMGWAIGQASGDTSARVFRTVDGGYSWRDVTPWRAYDLAEGEDVSAVGFFSTAQRAWVAFYRRPPAPRPVSAVVWYTADAGSSWTAGQPLDLTNLPLDLYVPSNMGFTDNQHGWLLVHLGVTAGRDAVALFTTQDGGMNWQRSTDPGTGALSDACAKSGAAFRDALNGWIVGDCGGIVPGVYLFKTSDGGHTWQPQRLNPPADFQNLYQDARNSCGVTTIELLPGRFSSMQVRCFPGGAARARSWLYTTLDGGQTWTPYALPTAYGSVQFLSPLQGWYLGASSTEATAEIRLYRTVDGGATWEPIVSLGWTGALDFVNSQSGWVAARAGDAQALVATSNGGLAWREIKPVTAP
jgi:photosystem II stability/assembly factor-like uncharacterized protein